MAAQYKLVEMTGYNMKLNQNKSFYTDLYCI